jgi:hypothetical protein
MTKIRINKLDAARRQINAAIRMTFEGEDPVAIHSVIAAGVCTENLIPVDDVMESPKLAE